MFKHRESVNILLALITIRGSGETNGSEANFVILFSLACVCVCRNAITLQHSSCNVLLCYMKSFYATGRRSVPLEGASAEPYPHLWSSFGSYIAPGNIIKSKNCRQCIFCWLMAAERSLENFYWVYNRRSKTGAAGTFSPSVGISNFVGLIFTSFSATRNTFAVVIARLYGAVLSCDN